MAPRTRSLLDLRFQQFGAYLVLGKGKTTAHGPFWICQCQCNQQVEIHHDALVEGRATHCGCAFGLLPGGKVRVNWVGRHVGQSLALIVVAMPSPGFAMKNTSPMPGTMTPTSSIARSTCLCT